MINQLNSKSNSEHMFYDCVNYYTIVMNYDNQNPSDDIMLSARMAISRLSHVSLHQTERLKAIKTSAFHHPVLRTLNSPQYPNQIKHKKFTLQG